MSESGRSLEIRTLWVIGTLCIALPVLTVVALSAGALSGSHELRAFGYQLLMFEIESARYLCLAGLLAFAAGWRLRAIGPAAYAVYGLLLNALALWLSLTPTMAS